MRAATGVYSTLIGQNGLLLKSVSDRNECMMHVSSHNYTENVASDTMSVKSFPVLSREG